MYVRWVEGGLGGGGVFFCLVFECVSRAFFLAFRMKYLGYFRVLRESSMCVYSSSKYWGLHMRSALRYKPIIRPDLILLL